MKERFIFVDIMKGWAMLTIVIFHANNSTINGNLGQLMGNPWNVPIFFIIAGFFLKTEKMQNPVAFMKHKLKGLYLPATVIYLMAVLMHNCCIDFGWYPLGQPHPGNGIPFSFYGIKETITGCVKVLLCAGSGELTMGAMWFLYTLIYAFAAMSLIYWCINKMIDPKVLSGGGKYIFPIILLSLGIVSCICSQKIGITINRVNVAFTAMLLIYEGMIINQKLQWRYDSKWMFAGCLMIMIHCILLQHVFITMANNCYQDLLQLCIGSASMLYVWGYIAKRIEKTILGRILALIGKESLYVMALHIVGFFLCTSMFWHLGILSPDGPHGMYTYNIAGNWWQLAAYVIFGIIVPLMTIGIFRWIRNFVIVKFS